MSAVVVSAVGALLTFVSLGCAVVASARQREASIIAKQDGNLSTAYVRQVEASLAWASALAVMAVANGFSFVGAWVLW